MCELKLGKFKPEYAGQVNFYLAVVDDLLRKPAHLPTIGLLLCGDKNHIVAEYALKYTTGPIGVAQYKLSKVIPEEFRSALPDLRLLEDELSNLIETGALENKPEFEEN